jgi:hypothetical protein
VAVLVVNASTIVDIHFVIGFKISARHTFRFRSSMSNSSQDSPGARIFPREGTGQLWEDVFCDEM